MKDSNHGRSVKDPKNIITPPVRQQPPEDDLYFWLKLAHTPGISPDVAQLLLLRLGSPRAIFNADANTLAQKGIRTKLRTAIQSDSNKWQELLVNSMEWLQGAGSEEPGRSIITLQDSRYPQSLASIPSPPVLLYIEGDPDILSRPAVAIVGSRKATPPAQALTRKLSGVLAANGLLVISGLAAGIDGAAHEGALTANGLTVAVTGTGLDRVYPRCHKTLANKITNSGAVVSEFPLGAPPIGHHFPRRNRVISGLSLGLVVVEAALRSGSLGSARHALEQGREVMAIPGAVNNPLSRGCHALIKSGATLVEEADDIMAEIADQIDTDTLLASGSLREALTPEPMSDPSTTRLLECMGYEPVTVDKLVDDSGLPANQVVTSLLQMELAGEVALDRTGRYTRCKA